MHPYAYIVEAVLVIGFLYLVGAITEYIMRDTRLKEMARQYQRTKGNNNEHST